MQPDLPAPDDITFHVLDGSDSLLPEWLALYESAFPPDERFSVETLLNILESGDPPGVRMLAVLDGSRVLAGLAIFEQREDLQVLFLWYLAVVSSRRSQGLGSVIYRQVIANNAAGCRAVVFDVEIPTLGADETERSLRTRRIEFYRRHGARVLTGIDYAIQPRPENPPVALHFMVHPLEPMDAGEAFELCRQVVGPQVMRQTGPLSLA